MIISREQKPAFSRKITKPMAAFGAALALAACSSKGETPPEIVPARATAVASQAIEAPITNKESPDMFVSRVAAIVMDAENAQLPHFSKLTPDGERSQYSIKRAIPVEGTRALTTYSIDVDANKLMGPTDTLTAEDVDAFFISRFTDGPNDYAVEGEATSASNELESFGYSIQRDETGQWVELGSEGQTGITAASQQTALSIARVALAQN